MITDMIRRPADGPVGVGCGSDDPGGGPNLSADGLSYGPMALQSYTARGDPSSLIVDLGFLIHVDPGSMESRIAATASWD